jgi:hypothetical protein
VKTQQQVVWRRWSVTKLASITFLSLAFSYLIDSLGFITKGRLAVVLIIPSLGVPNWSVFLHHQHRTIKAFFITMPASEVMRE